MLWLRYLLEAEAASRDLQRAVVTYDALLRDPAEALGAALARLDVTARLDGATLREFVDRGGRHHSGTKLEDADESGLAALCEEVHASFERIAAGGGEWDELRVHANTFQAAWLHWGENVDAVAAMAAELRARIEAGNIERARLAGELNAQVAWAADAVVRHEALEAERARIQSELTAQVRWSEEFVAAREAEQAEWALRSSQQAEALGELEATHSHALADLAAVSAQLESVLASASWRITRPVRAAAELGRKLAGRPAPPRDQT
jgi:hypothetical protein